MGSPRPVGPGRHLCVTVNGAPQHQCCAAISLICDRLFIMRSASGAGGIPASLLLDSPGKTVGLHLCPDLRHIVPEYDDIVLVAVDIPAMVAQHRFGLETEAFQQ